MGTTEAAIRFLFGFVGFSFGVFGDAGDFFVVTDFEVGRVEDVVVVIIVVVFGRGVAGGFRRARFEGLFRSDEFALFGRVFQGEGDFIRREDLAGAGFEVAAPEGADADADEFFDSQTHAGEHLADLAFEALFEDDAGAARREAADVFGLGLAFRDAESLEELDEDGVVEVLVECDPVFFFDAVGWVGERLGQYAVVGHDDEAFGVRIETADVVDVVVADGQEVVDGAVCSLRIAAAYDAAWFVEEDGDFLLGCGVASVHLDEVRREDADAGGVDGFAVDFDASFGDEFVCCPARFVPA